MELETSQITEGLLQFIDNSPTAYHAVDNVKRSLEQAGIYHKEVMQPDEGKGYILRGNSSLIAYKMPSNPPKGFHIIASHSDSPCFKLKMNPEITVDAQYCKLNVEKYGGMILSAWLDRPLGIAGRIICKKENAFVSKLVDLGRDCCVIPNVAIHLNREINKGYSYNPQVDLLPLYSADITAAVLDTIAQENNCSSKEILGSDLFLYVGQKAQCVGKNKEFLLAPRLDDLQCAYASLQGFLAAEPQEFINVYCLFDNEEVGSRTAMGADSDFLEIILKKLYAQMTARGDIQSGAKLPLSYEKMLEQSFLLSADNAHALHPNHPEKSDITNAPYLNQGIVLKFNGNAQYTTDGYSQAYVQDLCNQCGLKLQTFANRSDLQGGSTLGNIVMSHVSVRSADIGLAQLSMHSAVETAGKKDTVYLKKLSEYFYGL